MGTHIGVDIDIEDVNINSRSSRTSTSVRVLRYPLEVIEDIVGVDIDIDSRSSRGKYENERGLTCICYEDQQSSEKGDVGIQQDEDEVYSP